MFTQKEVQRFKNLREMLAQELHHNKIIRTAHLHQSDDEAHFNRKSGLKQNRAKAENQDTSASVGVLGNRLNVNVEATLHKTLYFL